MHRATYTNLRAIVDVTSQMTRALPSQGIEVKDWDPFLVFYIDLKLDEETRFEAVRRATSSSSLSSGLLR